MVDAMKTSMRATKFKTKEWLLGKFCGQHAARQIVRGSMRHRTSPIPCAGSLIMIPGRRPACQSDHRVDTGARAQALFNTDEVLVTARDLERRQ
jgi:hypothetical protein